PATVTVFDKDENEAGEITLNSDGTWTFDPEPGFTGDVPVEYTIEDPDELSDDATLTITVVPDVGNQTFANDDANLGSQGETLDGNILDNDFDPEGDTQTVTFIDTNGDGTPDTAPTAGTEIDIEQDGEVIGTLTLDPATGDYIWEPEPDFVGTAVIAYEVCDDGTPEACATATLYLTNLESTFTIEITDGPCWRTLSSPIAGETYAEFFARFRTNGSDFGGLWTQGATGDRANGFGDPNVFTMNSDGTAWVPVSDLSVEIPAGTGVLISVFDEDEYNNPSSAGFPKIAEFDGSDIDHESPVTVNLGTPEGTTSDANGFSMLGNPYKATIDFNELTRNEVEQIAWVYDRNTGNWLSYNGSNGDITDGLIAPGQGFVVQNVSSASSPSVEFPETAKTTGGTFVGKQQDRPDFVRLEIEGEELRSSMWLEFAEAGSFTKTTGDVIQLLSFESDYSVLSSLKDGQMYDIGRFPSAHEELQIPVIAEVTRAGTYTIRATDMLLPAGAELYLHDLQTGDRVLIDDGMEYTFRINQVAKRAENSCFTAPQKAKASVENRFMITTREGIDDTNVVPSEYRLSQNYPNPFNPATQIRYELPQQSDVRLDVFDMTGRQVATLVEGQVAAGTHTVTFDATNLSSGVYIYRLQAGSVVISKKLTLIK
ncbi:MAG: T9SS C-terminal target domain-containing protein, partial [Balneolaceae bacterium]